MYFSDLPLGFGLTLAENEVALNAFNGLAEEQKKEVIHRARQAQSMKEMHDLVAALAGKAEAL